MHRIFRAEKCISAKEFINVIITTISQGLNHTDSITTSTQHDQIVHTGGPLNNAQLMFCSNLIAPHYH